LVDRDDGSSTPEQPKTTTVVVFKKTARHNFRRNRDGASIEWRVSAGDLLAARGGRV